MARYGFWSGLFLGLGLLAWEVLPDTLSPIPTELTQSRQSFQDIGYIPNFYVAYVAEDGRLFGIQDHVLYVSTDKGQTFSRLGALPKPGANWVGQLTDTIARSKVVRAIRQTQGPSNLVVLRSGTILVFYDYIYRSTDNGKSFQPVFSFQEQQMGAGFAYSEGIAVGPDDRVYFGEYITTDRPHPVRVVEGKQDGREWHVVHTFPSGDMFHIHSIQYDPFRKGYWIAAGDTNAEAKVLFTGDGFRTFTILGQGSQDWRVVSMMVTRERLVWGSDNDEQPASIFQWTFASRTLEKLQEIGTPSYYSTVLADGTLVLSTTYEPVSPYTQRFQPETSTSIWMARPGKQWTRVLSLPYQAHQEPWGPSRAGIAFPGGAPTETLFYMPLSTTQGSNATHVARLGN